MCDEVEVGIGDPTDDLLEEKPGIILADVVILYVVVQLSTFGKFHNDEDIVAGVQNFVKFDDVVVVDEFENPDFPFDLGRGRGTFEIMCLPFILRLFIIFTATRTPVRSCRASTSTYSYI